MENILYNIIVLRPSILLSCDCDCNMYNIPITTIIYDIILNPNFRSSNNKINEINKVHHLQF